MIARPRVTEIMRASGLSPDFTGVPADILQEAAQRGTAVHAMIDNHQKGKNPRISWALRPYWTAYQRCVAESGLDPVAITTECRVEHLQWNYCGHPDWIGWLHARRTLIDWKCVASLDTHAVAIQLAAYELAWNSMYPGMPIHQCAAVQLKLDGSYRWVTIDTGPVRPIWLAAMTLYHYRLKTGRVPHRVNQWV